MRVVADLATNDILQVEKSPEIGEFNPFNGRYALPVPDGTELDVDSSSVIVPQNGTTDLAAVAAANLLARFPMYGNIAYNFLLEAADIAALDLALAPAVSAIAGNTPITRAQVGRGAGLNTGTAPNSVALLPDNTRVAPNRPGMLITDTIDITAPTSGAGADEFLVWWQLYDFNTTEDTRSDFGIFNGNNTPSERQISEIDQEPGTLSVFISHDDGTTWTPVGRLEPTDLITFDLSVRLAFLNTGPAKLYIAAYAVMF